MRRFNSEYGELEDEGGALMFGYAGLFSFSFVSFAEGCDLPPGAGVSLTKDDGGGCGPCEEDESTGGCSILETAEEGGG